MRIIFTFILFVFLQLIWSPIIAQGITFVSTIDGIPIEIDKAYGTDSLKIERLKFYVSPISFYLDEQLVYQSASEYTLIDFEKSEAQVIAINKSDLKPDFIFDQIQFELGVDSLNNVSGAMEGDLDPMYGMYWTWQSGYINFKLEGSANNCPARKNRFVFHLGGYQTPYLGVQKVSISVENSELNNLKIEIPIDELLKGINLKENHEIMSPGKKSVGMSKQLADLIKLRKG